MAAGLAQFGVDLGKIKARICLEWCGISWHRFVVIWSLIFGEIWD